MFVAVLIKLDWCFLIGRDRGKVLGSYAVGCLPWSLRNIPRRIVIAAWLDVAASFALVRIYCNRLLSSWCDVDQRVELS